MNLLTSYDRTRPRIAAVGMFDGVHAGHRHLLDVLCQAGDEMGLSPTVITFRNHPRKVVNPGSRVEMLSTLDDRLDMLSHAGIADCVVMDFDDGLRSMSARDFIVMLRDGYSVKAMVKGFNNRFGHERNLDMDDYIRIGREEGVEIICADEYRSVATPSVSSSTVRKLLHEHEVGKVAELLGRPYSIRGRVIHGKKLGRQLGFPTANIEPIGDSILVPGNGVYAAFATLSDGSRHRAILNIGHRPTVDGCDSPVNIEVHIMDYDGDLYGTEMRIEFMAFLRKEMRFSGLDELKAQLARDVEAANALLL